MSGTEVGEDRRCGRPLRLEWAAAKHLNDAGVSLPQGPLKPLAKDPLKPSAKGPPKPLAKGPPKPSAEGPFVAGMTEATFQPSEQGTQPQSKRSDVGSVCVGLPISKKRETEPTFTSASCCGPLRLMRAAAAHLHDAASSSISALPAAAFATEATTSQPHLDRSTGPFLLLAMRPGLLLP